MGDKTRANDILSTSSTINKNLLNSSAQLVDTTQNHPLDSAKIESNSNNRNSPLKALITTWENAAAANQTSARMSREASRAATPTKNGYTTSPGGCRLMWPNNSSTSIANHYYNIGLSTNGCVRMGDDDEDEDRIYGVGSTMVEQSSRSALNSIGSQPSIFDCFLSCHKSIKKYLARRKIEQGFRLYEQHNQKEAVRTWQSALNSTSHLTDRYQLLGYLYLAHMDWGKYREAFDYAYSQLVVAEEVDSSSMRAEANLNMARSFERLGGLEKALLYARRSLNNEYGIQCRSVGMVHLTVARVYLEMGGFTRALESLQSAHKIAFNINDSQLEMQIYCTLSELFGRLRDVEKSVKCASKAYDLSRALQQGDLNSSNHRLALLHMASALRKQGDLGDANDYCQEATRMAMIAGDQATYTRSIRILGDILRKKMDISRAFAQYQQSMGTASTLGDRMAQMEAMDGAARCLEILRLQQKICNCRPLEFNTRLLEVASSIGSMLLVRKVRSRLALIYKALGDEDQHKTTSRLVQQSEQALGLICGACDQSFGTEYDSLEVLPCSHILHARCAHEMFRKRSTSNSNSNTLTRSWFGNAVYNLDKTMVRTCPACQKFRNSQMQLFNSVAMDDTNGVEKTLPPTLDVLIDNDNDSTTAAMIHKQITNNKDTLLVLNNTNTTSSSTVTTAATSPPPPPPPPAAAAIFQMQQRKSGSAINLLDDDIIFDDYFGMNRLNAGCQKHNTMNSRSTNCLVPVVINTPQKHHQSGLIHGIPTMSPILQPSKIHQHQHSHQPHQHYPTLQHSNSIQESNKMFNQTNLSLASLNLRASNMAINNYDGTINPNEMNGSRLGDGTSLMCHVTSSV